MNHESHHADAGIEQSELLVQIVGFTLDEAVEQLTTAYGIDPQTAATIWAFENGKLTTPTGALYPDDDLSP